MRCKILQLSNLEDSSTLKSLKIFLEHVNTPSYMANSGTAVLDRTRRLAL